jgi:hypothetical protein
MNSDINVAFCSVRECLGLASKLLLFVRGTAKSEYDLSGRAFATLESLSQKLPEAEAALAQVADDLAAISDEPARIGQSVYASWHQAAFCHADAILAVVCAAIDPRFGMQGDTCQGTLILERYPQIKRFSRDAWGEAYRRLTKSGEDKDIDRTIFVMLEKESAKLACTRQSASARTLDRKTDTRKISFPKNQVVMDLCRKLKRDLQQKGPSPRSLSRTDLTQLTRATQVIWAFPAKAG